MGNEDKYIDTDAERQEHRISIEKDAANLDSVPGADATQKALFLEFASKDEDWKREMDKKLVRKIDLRLLPILVILYLLNFLDRLVSDLQYHHWRHPLICLATAQTSHRPDKATSNVILTCTAPTSTLQHRSSSLV